MWGGKGEDYMEPVLDDGFYASGLRLKAVSKLEVMVTRICGDVFI